MLLNIYSIQYSYNFNIIQLKRSKKNEVYQMIASNTSDRIDSSWRKYFYLLSYNESEFTRFTNMLKESGLFTANTLKAIEKHHSGSRWEISYYLGMINRLIKAGTLSELTESSWKEALYNSTLAKDGLDRRFKYADTIDNLNKAKKNSSSDIIFQECSQMGNSLSHQHQTLWSGALNRLGRNGILKPQNFKELLEHSNFVELVESLDIVDNRHILNQETFDIFIDHPNPKKYAKALRELKMMDWEDYGGGLTPKCYSQENINDIKNYQGDPVAYVKGLKWLSQVGILSENRDALKEHQNPEELGHALWLIKAVDISQPGIYTQDNRDAVINSENPMKVAGNLVDQHSAENPKQAQSQASSQGDSTKMFGFFAPRAFALRANDPKDVDPRDQLTSIEVIKTIGGNDENTFELQEKFIPKS